MHTQNNRQVAEAARRHFNAGELDAYINTLYAPDAVAHFLPPGMPQGHAGLRLFYTAFVAGFPDARLTYDEVLAEGDDMAIRFHIDATHAGDFNGIPATGKQISFAGITTLRFAAGKVVERWSHADFPGLMQQIGAMPALTAG